MINLRCSKPKLLSFTEVHLAVFKITALKTMKTVLWDTVCYCGATSSHLGMVWMMKMSCPRTDSSTSTLVSETIHSRIQNRLLSSTHGCIDKKMKKSDVYLLMELLPHLCLALDKPQTFPTRCPGAWWKNKSKWNELRNKKTVATLWTCRLNDNKVESKTFASKVTWRLKEFECVWGRAQSETSLASLRVSQRWHINSYRKQAALLRVRVLNKPRQPDTPAPQADH